MIVLQNLKMSVASLTSETNYLLTLLDRKQFVLIFSNTSIEDEFDSQSYCKLYEAIKAYSVQIPDANNEFLKEKLNELPAISNIEFNAYRFPGSSYILYFLLPLGIVVWTSRYLKLSALQHKMHGIVRTLGTTEFILKALLN